MVCRVLYSYFTFVSVETVAVDYFPLRMNVGTVIEVQSHYLCRFLLLDSGVYVDDLIVLSELVLSWVQMFRTQVPSQHGD